MTNPAIAVPGLSAQRRQMLRNDQIAVRANLNGAQTDLEVGQAIPIVFGKRSGGAGGVWLSPPATECRFENDTDNSVTVSYHLVLSDGQIGTISEGDVYQGDTPLVAANFQQAYNTRAGSWSPGNFIEQRFGVEYTNQRITIEGKPIGNDNANALDVSGLSPEEINQLVNNNKAVLEYNSNGNYVTFLRIQVAKTIDWPTEGIQFAARGELSPPAEFRFPGVYGGGGGAEYRPFLPLVTKPARNLNELPWQLVVPSQRVLSATNTSSPSISGGISYQEFTVGNQWIYDRGNEARYFPIEDYQINRPASVDPYGEIELEFTEIVRPGFVTTKEFALTYGTLVDPDQSIYYYDVGLFGGLPGVLYDVTIEEINSIPLPRPEATLYCGTGGSYAGLSTLSVVKSYPPEFDNWQRQIHVFAREGRAVPRLIEETEGASNQYPDLARYLMKASARTPDDLIDDAQLLAAAEFCDAQGLLCDGIVASPSNVREWIDRTAPLFLLKPTNRWGRMGLRPAVATDGNDIDTDTITPEMVFDESNIVPGSLNVSYVPRSERTPLAALVLWRDQPEDDIGVMQPTEVRYECEAIDGPYYDIDGSEFITRENHALKVGALWLARRRHIAHTASFQVLPTAAAAALLPGAIVRVNRKRNPTVGAASHWSYLYEVDTITGPPLGPWTIGATHFPVDAAGRSLIALDVANAYLA